MLKVYEGKAHFRIVVVVIKCTKMSRGKRRFLYCSMVWLQTVFPIQAVSSTHMYCHSLLPISHTYFNINYRSDKYDGSLLYLEWSKNKWFVYCMFVTISYFFFFCNHISDSTATFRYLKVTEGPFNLRAWKTI